MTTKQIAEELEATVREAAERLRALDAATLAHRPSPERWTIKQVIGHLIDSAANNHQRFVRGQFTEARRQPRLAEHPGCRRDRRQHQPEARRRRQQDGHPRRVP